ETYERGRLRDVFLEGRVETASGAILSVAKQLRARYNAENRAEVRTAEYAYHAFISLDEGERSLFRYDNSHGGLDTIHRHEFRPDGSAGPIVDLSHDELPP